MDTNRSENKGFKKEIKVIDTVVRNGKYVNAHGPLHRLRDLCSGILASISSAVGTLLSLF